MVVARRVSVAPVQGHVAIYARDARWRRAIARRLDKIGHSHREAESPEAMRELLRDQRFDVLALKVRDEEEARDVAGALKGVDKAVHGILVGSPAALPLILRSGQRGSFRYVPGAVSPPQLGRLVEASISTGTWEDGAPLDGGAALSIQEVDLEEAIDRAASAVYRRASRKRQRFHTLVEGPGTIALASPSALRRTLVSLLELLVELAPRRARIAVEARAGAEEWVLHMQVSTGDRSARARMNLTEALHERADVLSKAARDIRKQGGLLWVEFARSAALGLCLTLPLPLGTQDGTLPPVRPPARPAGGGRR